MNFDPNLSIKEPCLFRKDYFISFVNKERTFYTDEAYVFS